MSDRFPIDAASWGRLRQFKAELADRYARLDRLLETNALDTDANAIASRDSITGRQRAFQRMRQKIAATGAALEGVRLEGKFPLAAWAVMLAALIHRRAGIRWRM